MRKIQGNDLPSVWSDLFLEYKDVEGKIDIEPSISTQGVLDWLEEYSNMQDNISGNAIHDLAKRGSTQYDYLISIKHRLQHMYDMRELDFDTWKSSKTTLYPGEKLSEAARERMVLTEEEYQMKQTVLIRIKAMVGLASDVARSLNAKLEMLALRLKGKMAESPRLPIS